ncbi:MAG TPA: hypothetical protein VHC46_09865, partial [Thermodesulfobacteriota bacterium]|nr:hypothetical protein [Thermodesulfobacteriota bacterium]
SLYVDPSGLYPISKATLYINDSFVQTIDQGPFIFRFSPKDVPNIQEMNTIRVVAQDSVYDRNDASMQFKVALDQ